MSVTVCPGMHELDFLDPTSERLGLLSLRVNDLNFKRISSEQRIDRSYSLSIRQICTNLMVVSAIFISNDLNRNCSPEELFQNIAKCFVLIINVWFCPRIGGLSPWVGDFGRWLWYALVVEVLLDSWRSPGGISLLHLREGPS